LYNHRSPGWYISGSDPSAAIHVSGSWAPGGQGGPQRTFTAQEKGQTRMSTQSGCDLWWWIRQRAAIAPHAPLDIEQPPTGGTWSNDGHEIVEGGGEVLAPRRGSRLRLAQTRRRDGELRCRKRIGDFDRPGRCTQDRVVEQAHG